MTCTDRHLTRTRQGLAGLGVVIVAALAPLILFTSSGPDAAGAKAAAVALVVVHAATLVWMPTRPELAMSVSIAAGVGIEQLCPDLGFLGVANISLSAFSWLRPPRISLWVLGVMIALFGAFYKVTAPTIYAPWAAVGVLAIGAILAVVIPGRPSASQHFAELAPADQGPLKL